MKFTKQQIADFHDFERVRKSGDFNMFHPNARLLAGLSRTSFLFVMKNYAGLKVVAMKETA